MKTLNISMWYEVEEGYKGEGGLKEVMGVKDKTLQVSSHMSNTNWILHTYNIHMCGMKGDKLSGEEDGQREDKEEWEKTKGDKGIYENDLIKSTKFLMAI